MYMYMYIKDDGCEVIPVLTRPLHLRVIVDVLSYVDAIHNVITCSPFPIVSGTSPWLGGRDVC